MAEQIQFNDGAAYERYMGTWSQLAGEAFLEWLAPGTGLRWLDVGCGNGAFTELIVNRCAPASVNGIDPSAAQIAFARARPAGRFATFESGDAMALPFGGGSFDVAVMPLVIFFVPDPARGVAEMVRVVTAGGIVAAYAWDMPGHGFPYDALFTAMDELGVRVPPPPSPDASRLDVMQDLWSGAGLESVTTRVITVERTFEDFDDYWTTILGSASVGTRLAALDAAETGRLQRRLRDVLSSEGHGRVTCSARANAIQGRVETR